MDWSSILYVHSVNDQNNNNDKINVCNALSNSNNLSTLYIKEIWEREVGIEISEEKWEQIWDFQWSSTCSTDWREHCWKNIIRFFRTPYQEKYRGDLRPCWRECSAERANHFHIFWECPKLKSFWENVHKSLCSVFNCQLPFDFLTLYLGYVEGITVLKDKKLLQVLLVACKKSITRRWLTPNPPTLGDWYGIILEIFKMEKLTYFLRTQKEKFYQIWEKWILHISPIRADFI